MLRGRLYDTHDVHSGARSESLRLYVGLVVLEAV